MTLHPLQLTDDYRFETPEQIDVSYVVAGLGSRGLAALIDAIIVTIAMSIVTIPGSIGVTVLIRLILHGLGHRDVGDNLVPIIVASMSLVGLAMIGCYYVFFEAFWHGQTPGKRWIGIRVIREGGRPLTFSASMIRNVIRLIDFLPFYYMIGVIVMFIDRKSRRLGDFAAHTIVVKEQKSVKLDSLDASTRVLPSTSTPIGDSARLAIRNVRHLTSEDRRMLREYLHRRDKLSKESADRIGTKLAQAFALKTGYDLGAEAPILFLERLARTIDEEAE